MVQPLARLARRALRTKPNIAFASILKWTCHAAALSILTLASRCLVARLAVSRRPHEALLDFARLTQVVIQFAPVLERRFLVGMSSFSLYGGGGTSTDRTSTDVSCIDSWVSTTNGLAAIVARSEKHEREQTCLDFET